MLIAAKNTSILISQGAPKWFFDGCSQNETSGAKENEIGKKERGENSAVFAEIRRNTRNPRDDLKLDL